MRRAIAFLAGLGTLVLANLAILRYEKLRTEGRIVLLELAPVDPRSLMQGDYMALDFQLLREVVRKPHGERDGRVVVVLDERGVGRFLRFDDGSPLAPNHARLRYRVRDGRPRVATNAFFFEEGTAARYEPARYGELRVDEDGEALLTGLRDEDLRGL